MINLLFDLQLSMLTSLDDGDFLFTPDSNCNVATFTIKNLVRKYQDLNIYVLVPSPSKIVGLNKKSRFDTIYRKFTEDLSEYKDRIKLVKYNYFGNPFVDRMTFNSRELKKSLKDIERIDVVFTNDPCKVLSYKTFFYYKEKRIVPVICRNHWVTGKKDRKVPEQIDFFIRQFEGAVYSESMSFNSNFAINLFLENAKEFFSKDIIKRVKSKCYAIETVDIEKIDKYYVPEKFDIFSILFAHRLSYYTGWKETLDSLLQLWEKRKDFQVFVPDPGNKTTQDELKNKYPFINKIDKSNWSHEDYLKLCWKMDLCLGNHKCPATWGGLSITESMCAHTVPIMPNRWAYKEMMWKKTDSKIFFKDEKEMNHIIERYIDSKNSLENMKLSARKFCEKNLSINKYIDKTYSEIKKSFRK